jgi:ketosteroid isomerase-like protein
MKKLFAVFVLLAGACSTALGQDLSFDAGAKPHAGLDAVYAKFSKAYRELDHELVGGLYSSDASYLVPDQNILIGRDKIIPTFKSFFDYVRERKGRMTISFKIVQRRVSGDMAYDVGIYTLTQYDSAGKGSTGQGKFVVVAVKEKSGEWKFQVDGYSDLAKPKI